MLKKYWALLLVPFLLGCSGISYHSPGPYSGGPILGSGTYMQEISVEKEDGDTYRYKCIFQRKAHSVLVTALSFKGEKIFQIADNLTPKLSSTLKFFPSELDRYRDDLRKIYLGFRPIFFVGIDSSNADSSVKEKYPDRRPRALSDSPELSLVVDEYDWDGHAFKLTVRAPKLSARVSLREYTSD